MRGDISSFLVLRRDDTSKFIIRGNNTTGFAAFFSRNRNSYSEAINEANIETNSNTNRASTKTTIKAAHQKPTLTNSALNEPTTLITFVPPHTTSSAVSRPPTVEAFEAAALRRCPLSTACRPFLQFNYLYSRLSTITVNDFSC